MRGLRLRKGRNLPEVIQLVRGELGFMLRLICLVRLPPSLPLCGGSGLGVGAGNGSCGGFHQKATSPECRKQLACLFCPFPNGNLSFEKTWLPRRGGFYTQNSSFSFSVSTAAADCEGVGGDVSEVLLGPNEHKQL